MGVMRTWRGISKVRYTLASLKLRVFSLACQGVFLYTGNTPKLCRLD